MQAEERSYADLSDLLQSQNEEGLRPNEGAQADEFKNRIP
jgi:hypothetical protein